MNAVEIEAAVSELAEKPFDAQEFAYDFLRAFGNKETTIKKLRVGQSNSSDIQNGVLQRNYIHIAICDQDSVTQTLSALRESKATEKAKAKFILATDGADLQAEDLISGEAISSTFSNFAEHFGFFLPLAGISTIREIKDNPIDVRATGRLNKLYIELLKENPDWATEERRQDMNHFMARLIFCFFAEDTEIFQPSGIFTQTIEQMSERDSSNTHEVISTLFHAMNVDHPQREDTKLPVWARKFPYVNGGLFSGSKEVPKFSKIARTYLLHAGKLNWQEINPDIFGSMIQAVTNDDERGSLGMHYTSVPNILKVLNPLFLDDLNEQLEASKESSLKLLNLRKRIARIRVFDPACGSGNFLVIAYKQLRKIEAKINELRGEIGRATDIPLTNFRGIEINSFPAEIARLALVIAEYQSNVQYCGQIEALQTVLPLSKENWIICGNALRLDWLSICPPTGNTVKVVADDLFETPLEQTEIDFENEGGETYICGNPPYLGSQMQSASQKKDLEECFKNYKINWKSLDYVSGWFIKSSEYLKATVAKVALVTTNSLNQGQQVSNLWPHIFKNNCEIIFAYRGFKWANLAQYNAGVIVSIIGLGKISSKIKKIYEFSNTNEVLVLDVKNLNAYLVSNENIFVDKRSTPISELPSMTFGNQPIDGGGFVLTHQEEVDIVSSSPSHKRFIYNYLGSREFINGLKRKCLWINDQDLDEALNNPIINKKIDDVKEFRLNSDRKETIIAAQDPHKFVYRPHVDCEKTLIIPSASSERREYLPCGLLSQGNIVSNLSFAIYNAELWCLSLIVSKLHLIWISTVCGKLKSDYRYSNTIGWNTFPVPKLTEKNKADLTRCAENILLAREAHFPATIADLYDPEKMPENLRAAHEQNDEVLERIYIGRRFKNDTERLEKLFSMYTEMTSKQVGKK
ncbi:TPA: class I SAM-dependent DNA methyltransferase [Acinetobacter baumannii]|uniref:site-specific DNA-methyltransferase (adenine-specific) n=1 Tax=Acinetobacter pittii TaxID=48296 RepID=A0A6H0FZ85_ACIPI|nr:class I SAM-dependent DNA methyltransferase [Acinetobacter baumannii]QIT19671.1 class I SAM-dependent DNA methyltransferase [Acinetobacter pittii]QSG57705.1 class I SAM-dependent DNA methyltransferase [Acinetobacter baumannii]QSG64962.1 class I SAM-dependent DNA methyltransferase [Acinetobacter baumannii]HEE5644687.1 class I SAM-dependent DNA methyltransferase [Acinetobacter baumannii]HEE5652504.1 class I SAM-dependent DNA methyltransferase [Acinetobacter baumannii]